MGDYGERAKDIDAKIPPERKAPGEIEDYMKDRFGDTMPDDFIEGVAPEVANIRERQSGPGPGTGADIEYDPDAGQWRDGSSGAFISEEEANRRMR